MNISKLKTYDFTVVSKESEDGKYFKCSDVEELVESLKCCGNCDNSFNDDTCCTKEFDCSRYSPSCYADNWESKQ